MTLLRSWLVGVGVAVVAGIVAEAEEITNSVGMKLVFIPAGEFMMGSGESADDLTKAFAAFDAKPEKFKDEYPQHRVRISKPFYLGAHEVTVGQFRQFVNATDYKTDAEKDGRGGFGFDGTSFSRKPQPQYTWRNTGFAQTDEHPVVNVTWNDAVAFCTWLSEKEGKKYRLPTEAEWEYACRAGTTTRWWHGDDPEKLAEVDNVADGTLHASFRTMRTIVAKDGYVFTAPVGRFKANRFGLYDMHGNVWEWCGDWYDAAYYSQSPILDPTGPSHGTRRTLRGGSWGSWPSNTRSAHRDYDYPDLREIHLGFRAARNL